MERYDPIGIAALYARSSRDALQRLARYKQLTCPPEIRLMYQGDECAVQFQWLLARESEPAVLIDVCFAWRQLVVAARGFRSRLCGWSWRDRHAKSHASTMTLQSFGRSDEEQSLTSLEIRRLWGEPVR